MKIPCHRIIPRLVLAALFATVAVETGHAQLYPATILSNNPVGYWRLNEQTVSPPLRIIANAGSLGPVGNGIAMSNTQNGATGIVGNAIRFSNGNAPTALPNTGFVRSKINVQWNAALNPNPPFSVEFWAKPVSLGTDATGFCPIENFDPNHVTGGASRAGWLFYLNNLGQWEWRIGALSGYAGIVDATNTAIPNLHAQTNGTTNGVLWQHIVGTWDGVTASIYVDGMLAGAVPAPKATWANNRDAFLRIGGTPLIGTSGESPYEAASSVNGNRGYDGYLDEVAFYSNLLSPSTVMAHYMAATTNNAGYHAQILGDTNNVPVAYWEFEDAILTPPLQSALPIATNIGLDSHAADGTNEWGVLAGQAGPGYPGFGAGSGSIFLDGENGYVQLQDDPGLHTNFATGLITMMAWIKPTAQDFYRDILEHGFTYNDGGETFLRISQGPDNGGYGSGAGSYYQVGSSDGGLEYGQDAAMCRINPGDIGNWVFLAGTFDGEAWNLYRNGVLVGQTTASAGDIGNFDVQGWWSIGSRLGFLRLTNGATITPADPEFNGQEESFAGNLSEVALFTNALTGSQIAALYAASAAPPIFTVPAINPGVAFQGSTVSLSVDVDGVPPITYLWYSNGLSTGVTTTNYSIPNIAVGSYNISVVASSPYGTNTNIVAFTTVLAPPVITSAPVPATRYVGYPFDFTATATGSPPLTYIWEKGGTILQSGASPTYTNVASLADAGTYTLVVSNIVTAVTNTAAVLTVNSITGGYATAITTTGPLAYYLMNETSGTVCHDSVGGFDGVYNSATLGQTGFSPVDSDTSVAFSGTNSYVGSISGTLINFTGFTNFTLEAWVNAQPGLPDQSSVIAKGIGNNGTDNSEQFSLDVAGGVYRFYTAGNANVLYAATATEGPNGTWQHVVGVYDGLGALGGPGMYIYVDGVMEGNAAPPTAGLNNTQSPVSIGSKRTGNSPFYDGTFKGNIDEVAIYDKALDATTVENHYGAAYGSSLAPVITLAPTPVTNYAGLSASFAVSGYGTVPLSYQWNLNGSPISGATSPTLTINPLTLADNGNITCSIINSVSTTTTPAAKLTVLSAPTTPPAIPGLVLHLPLNGSLLDVSGRGHNAIGYYATTNSTNVAVPPSSPSYTYGNGGNPPFYYAPDGVLNQQALHYSTMAFLNGSTSIGTNDYYASLGVVPDLQFGSNVNFTVSYWIRLPLNYEGGDLPFFTDTVGSTFGTGIVFAPAYGYGTATPNPNPAPTSPGGWALSVFGTGGVGIGYYGLVGSINDGAWHNFVHVFNRTNANVITYLDGFLTQGVAQTGSTTLSGAGNITSGNAATIGQDPTGLYGETGSGDIEDLGIWRTALTPLQAASIFVAGASNNLSYVGVPLTFTIQQPTKTNVTLTWNFGTLMASTNVAGPYSALTNTSPFTTNVGGTRKFYQVKD